MSSAQLPWTKPKANASFWLEKLAAKKVKLNIEEIKQPELDAALIVNPYDMVGVAAAIARGLAMTLSL